MRRFFLSDKLLHILINLSPKKRLLVLSSSAGFLAVGCLSLFAVLLKPSSPQLMFEKMGDSGMSVLAAQTKDPNFAFNVNIPSVFNDDVAVNGGLTVKGKAVFTQGLDLNNTDVDLGTGKITASNIVYNVKAGDGIGITGGQNPTISNTGVTSLQGQTGALTLQAGDGIKIDGLKISLTGSSTSGDSGSSGVSTLDGLEGGLTIANTSGSGSEIIIDDASTSQKGIASFDDTNFTTTNGRVNTVQDISTDSSPTFQGLTTTGTASVAGALTVNGSTTLAPTTTDTDTLTLRASPGTNSNILDITSHDGSTSYLSMSSDGALTVNGSTLTNAGILESGGAIHLTNSTDAVVGTAVAQGWTLNGNTFTYRRQITVNNTSSSLTLPVNNEITVTLSSTTASDVCTNSRTDSADIRTSYNTTEIARNLTRTCNTTVTFSFQLQAPISPLSSSTSYYIYYNNPDLNSAAPTYVGNLPIDTLDTIPSWVTSDTTQFPITAATVSGVMGLKAIGTVNNVATPSATSQSPLDAAVTNFASIIKAIAGTTYLYVMGGSTDGTAANARSTIYRTSINSTTGNVGVGTTNSISLPSAVMDNATAVVVPPIDAGDGSDGTLDLSLGAASGGCIGSGLSWSGSACTIKTQVNALAGPTIGSAAGVGANSFEIPSGSQSGKFLTIVGAGSTSTYLYDPTTNTYATGPTLPTAAGAGASLFQIPSGSQSGKFLIILGGSSSASALYDPSTNTFTVGPSLTASSTFGAHSFQIPSGSQAGKFLAVIGSATNIYDPSTNTFTVGPAVGATVSSGGHSIQITSGTNAGKFLTITGSSTTTKIYDPSTNTYGVGPALTTAATTGSNSFVVPSGSDADKIITFSGNSSTTTNIYDPANNTYSAGPTLANNVYYGAHWFTIPSGTNAGKILIISGNGSNTNLYNPSLGTFSSGPTLGATSNYGSHSFIIPSGTNAGKIFTVAGSSSGSSTSTGVNTRLYDPSTNTYSAGPNIGAVANTGAHAVLITTGSNIGKYLIVAGNTSSATSLYDPITNIYTVGPDLGANAKNGSHSFTIPSGSNAGKILTFAGNSSTVTRVYDPSTNTYSTGPTLSANAGNGANSFTIPSGSNAGKILTVLGNSQGNTSIYDPSTNTFSSGPALGVNSSVGAFSFSISSGSNAGKIFVVAGAGGTNTRIYDPSANTFSAGPTLTGGPGNGAHGIQIPSGTNAGKTLIIIGQNGTTTYIYDPVANSFSSGPSLTGNANLGSLSFLIQSGPNSGKILTTLGNGAATTNIFDPTTNTYSVGPTLSAGTNDGVVSFHLSSGLYKGSEMIISGNTTSTSSFFLPGKSVFNFTTINIPNGTSVTSDGPYSDNAGPHTVTFNATGNVLIGGTVNLSGLGYSGGAVATAGYGPGAPTGTSAGGGCGGSYGGVGGNGGGSITCSAGSTYTIEDSGSGGGGAGTGSSAGTAGGGGFIVTSTGSVTVNGTGVINVDGAPGAFGGGDRGGGGSGGLIHLTAITITNSGALSAKGGAGAGSSFTGSGGGGGGGGGRITFSYQTSASQGSSVVTGGAAGQTSGTTLSTAGSSGIVTVSSIAPTVYSLGGKNISGTPVNNIYQATVSGSDGSIGTFSSSANNLPQTLSGLTAHTVTLGISSYLYTIGGNNGSSDQTSVYKYIITGSSVGAGTTSGQSQLPVGLSKHASTQGSISGTNYMWVVGGLNGSTAQTAIYKATINGSGDVISLTASGQTALPVGLYSHSATFVTVGSNNYLYIYGGKTTGGASQTTVYRATIDSSGNVTSVDTVGQAQLGTALSGQGAFPFTDNSSRQAVYLLGGLTSTAQSAIVKASINTDQTTYKTYRTNFSPIDLSNKNDISFWTYGSTTGSYMTMDINTGTAGSPSWQTCSFNGSPSFTVSVASTWEQKDCDISAISSRTAVTGFRFRVTSSQTSDFTITFDQIHAYTNLASITNTTSAAAAVLGSANLTLNAQGSGIVAVNYDPTNGRAGTGGMIVYNGATTPLFTIDSNGNASTSGNMRVVGTTILSGNVGIGTTSTANPLTIGSNTSNGNGAFVSAGGAWTNGSSREFKENFTTLDSANVLDKINQLNIQQWNYKNEDSSVKHIGPIAEDFYTIFNVGNDPQHISTIDPAGVALLGIQELSKELTDLRMQVMGGSISAQFVTAENLGVDSKTATVSGTLTVLGRTVLSDVGVTGTLVSGLMSIDGSQGSVNVLGDLKLQPEGIGTINLFNGKVVVDNKGNMMTKGVLSAKKIFIDESNSAAKSIGNATVKMGALNVTVTTSALTPASHILATPDSPVIYGVKKADSDSFVIFIQDQQPQDIHFDWWIVN